MSIYREGCIVAFFFALSVFWFFCTFHFYRKGSKEGDGGIGDAGLALACFALGLFCSALALYFVFVRVG